MKVLHSFTARILAIMVALLLLFCAVSTLAWYRSFTREAVETAQAHLDTVIETLNETFEESLREIDYTTAFISNKVRSTQNNCVVQFLTAQESNAQIASLQQARSYLFNRCNFKAYLNGVSIYGFDGRICTYGITTPYDEVSQTEWFSQIQSGQADVVYLTPHAYTSKQPSPKSSYVFSIVRPVLNNGTIIGVIKADVKSSLLETIFDIQEMQGYALYVFDRDTGEAVYVPEGADTLPLTRFQDSVPRGHGSYTDQIGGADCLVVYTTSEITPWQIVGVVRQNTVISGFLQVRNRMLLIVLLCAALFAVIAFALAHYLTKDLRRLTRAVEQTGDEALELPIRITRQDEVGILYQRICAMLARIRTLITNIRCAEAEKRTSEIAMLSMQINPHFLYNTFETMRGIALSEHNEKVADIVKNISEFMRYNMYGADGSTSLQMELQHVTNYIRIMDYRFDDKIRLTMEIPEQMRALSMPKFTLQPIVENAVLHGFTEKRADCEICISGQVQDGAARLRIVDNGCGIAADALEKINADLKEPFQPGQPRNGRVSIGIYNVNSRLKLNYGDKYGVRIFSEVGVGTTAEIEFPAVMQKPGADSALRLRMKKAEQEDADS